ncbi:MAG: OmpA family protein [Bacteroidales bacterium]|nr:OmpA family protein [Bacteroidales bacterium]MDY6001715.1 OmpA family protein [Candidatus Cryptobacteroides sp.]
MKRVLTVLASFALVATMSVAHAQTKDFDDYWFIQLQGGAAETIGETNFWDLVSPSAAFSVGYRFSPVFGARLNVNGWQGKGSIAGPRTNYKFNYVETGLDLYADLASLFAGYKYDRLLNPYIFAGGGVNYAFNNDEANDHASQFPKVDNYLWDGHRVLGAARTGLGLNIRLSDVVAFNVEGNCSFLGDHFNSKKGSAADFQIKALAGLTLSFGKSKPAIPAPVVVPAPVPAPKPQPKAEPEPEPEPVVQEPAFESLTRNVLFVINKWDIRDSEQYKIDEVVEALKDNPDTKVRVSGYADKATGTAKRNMFLSQKRAEVVAQAIIDAGIDKERVTTEYFGDTVNPFETPEQNRVAVCVVKK